MTNMVYKDAKRNIAIKTLFYFNAYTDTIETRTQADMLPNNGY